MKPVRIGPIHERIQAPRALIFEMSSAVGGALPGAPAHSSELVDRQGDVMLVRYRTPVLLWSIEFLEEVRLEAPDAISYRLIRGPWSHVRERLTFEADGATTIVTYDGTVVDHRPLGSVLVRLIALPAYRRFMRRSLQALRGAAETRAARSQRHPSPASAR